MDASNLLYQLRSRLRQLDLEGAALDEVVEVGTALANLVRSATQTLDEIKEILRQEAIEDLDHEPGTTSFGGTRDGHVSVTVPKPRLVLTKDTDPEVLKQHLGSGFDLIFETRTTYVPRKNAGKLVLDWASEKDKALLLMALTEQQGKPRVMFAKR